MGKSEQKLKYDLNIIRERLIKIGDQGTRRYIASSIEVMGEKNRLSNKRHYDEWKTKALDALSKKGNIKC